MISSNLFLNLLPKLLARAHHRIFQAVKNIAILKVVLSEQNNSNDFHESDKEKLLYIPITIEESWSDKSAPDDAHKKRFDKI